MPSRSASPVTVLINGAPDPTLRALSVQRSTGGGLRDHATYQIDLGATGAHIQNLALLGPAGAEVRFVAAINGAQTLLHWGRANVMGIEIGAGERLTVTSSVQPYHFGVPLTGEIAWDPLSGSLVTVQRDVCFNPRIDGAALPNASSIGWLPQGTPVFLDPESVRTPQAQAVQGAVPVPWTLQTAIAYLCWALNDQQFIQNPTGFGLIPDWPLNDFHLERGKFLPEYLDQILPRFGLTWGLDLSSGQPTIAWVVRGQGNPNSVYLGAPGSAYAGDNAAESRVDYNVGNTRNQAIVAGDFYTVESTFLLARGWDAANDSIQESLLAKDSANGYQQLPATQNVWRNWVLNEAGDYVGRRPENLAPFDLAALIGFPTVPRRRKFLPTLTLSGDSAPIGETGGVVVEYSTDGGATWLPIDKLEDRTCVVLERECGIRFDGTFPPPELVRAGAQAQVRVTASIRSDVRLGEIVGPDQNSPLAETAPFYCDESRKFHWRAVLPTSKFFSQVAGGQLHANLANDLAALADYAAWLQDTFDIADVGGTLTVEGLDNGVYQLGDLITAINGRAIDFNAQSAATAEFRFPQIVSISYDCQAQHRVLQIETYRDPNQRPGEVTGYREKETEQDARQRHGQGEFSARSLRRYQLTADLSAGGSAAAKFIKWDPTNTDYADANQTFTLYSFGTATGTSGTQGYCAYFPDRGQWEVLEAGAGSADVRRVRFMLPQALTNQGSVDNCPIIDDWYGNSGASSVTVWNEDGWQGDAGAEGIADWNPSEAKWVIMLLPCPTGGS